jgi:hypothetical protein
MTLVTTPYSSANSYVSVDEASVFLSQRPYTQVWTSADPYPDASGYTVSGSVLSGSSTVPMSSGTGIFQAGTLIRINGGQYKVKIATTEDSTSLTLVSGVTTALTNGMPIDRLSANTQEAALIWATLILDRTYRWEGTQTASDQTLAWPRMSVMNANGDYYDSSTVPEILRRVTSELAMHLLQRDNSRLPKVIGTGLKRAILPGPLQVDVDPKNVVGVIPPYIHQQLTQLGQPITGILSFSFASLSRT